jgi:glycosyltransferase involved in cell wall biosynthesis
MLFSILIANYNNGSFFKDCYDSIVNQSYQDFEVIIVDDASTDDSIEIIKQLTENDSRFKLFHNDKNRGCGYTKRRCVELATGELCGFVDPDDTITIEALQVMVDALTSNPNVSIVSSKFYLTDIELNVKKESNQGQKIPDGKTFLTFGKGAITHFCTFKRTNYLKTDGINSCLKRAVDQDLYLKMEEVGLHLFLDQFLYNYRINANSISANQNVYKAYYWALVACEDAYLRRIKSKTIDPSEYLKFVMDKRYYLVQRMKRCVKNKKYWNKYYLLYQLIKTDFKHNLFFLDYKYKIKSLVFIKFS